jgi:hypothetical protein
MTRADANRLRCSRRRLVPCCTSTSDPIANRREFCLFRTASGPLEANVARGRIADESNMPANDRANFNIHRCLRVSTGGLTLCVLLWCAAVPLAQPPQATPTASARTWLGHEAQIEAHLKSADVTTIEHIGTGVTRPRRAYLKPPEPVESAAWKVLPPGKRGGYWESYKSEIAAYELDKLLNMKMVPPAVERQINADTGAAVMWLEGIRSVKEMGGKVPTGSVWGNSLRKMLMFDNLIGNPDRNAGNILVGPPGELILIDHSRAFLTDKNLLSKVERVDGELWDRMKTLTREDLTRALQPWIDTQAIGAMIERRDRMAATVDQLVATKGQSVVIIR